MPIDTGLVIELQDKTTLSSTVAALSPEDDMRSMLMSMGVTGITKHTVDKGESLKYVIIWSGKIPYADFLSEAHLRRWEDRWGQDLSFIYYEGPYTREAIKASILLFYLRER